MKGFIISVIASFALIAATGCGSGVPVDSEMMDLIKAASQNCKVDTRYAFVESCSGGEAAKIENLIKEKGVTASLGTLANALNDKDEKIKAVACKFIYRQLRDNIGELEKNSKDITVPAAELFIKGVAETKAYVAFYAVEIATHLAMMKGKEDLLYKTLAEHPEKYVKLEGYRHLMRFGRMKAFPKVQELSGSTDAEVAAAALEAPNNIYNLTDNEKGKICDWSKTFLGNGDVNLAYAAAKTMGRCGGTYIDALLDEAEKRGKEGKLETPFSNSLTGFTFSCKSMFGSPPTGSKEQCDRRDIIVKMIRK